MCTGNDPKWNDFVMKNTKVWQHYFRGWAIRGLKHPVLVVRYEDLIRPDRIGEIVKKMLAFLEVPYSEDELRDRLKEDLGTLPQHRGDFEHFTHKQKKHVRQAIAETFAFLKKWNRGDTLDVATYLNT